MQRATLAGVPGDVDLQFRFRHGMQGEWRGTFAFRPDDEPTLAGLVGDRPAVLETVLEEERRILRVTITALERGRARFRTSEWSIPTDVPTTQSPTVHAA
jgi:hypothetical protein